MSHLAKNRIAEQCWASLSIAEYYWALLSIAEQCRASLSITEYYWALLSIAEHHWALLSITEHHWALLSIAEHWWAFLISENKRSSLRSQSWKNVTFLSSFQTSWNIFYLGRFFQDYCSENKEAGVVMMIMMIPIVCQIDDTKQSIRILVTRSHVLSLPIFYDDTNWRKSFFKLSFKSTENCWASLNIT